MGPIHFIGYGPELCLKCLAACKFSELYSTYLLILLENVAGVEPVLLKAEITM